LLLQTRKKVVPAGGLFPRRASLETETPDVALERGYQPLFGAVYWLLSLLAWIQQGRVSMYVLYIAVTMVALLVWYVF
jgi:hypothetical protein